MLINKNEMHPVDIVQPTSFINTPIDLDLSAVLGTGRVVQMTFDSFSSLSLLYLLTF
jgi:hypothetical protein